MTVEPRIVALAGGVGGAKLAEGLARSLAPGQLTVIVNTGDDFEHFGLYICPDLDTVCYTLAGKANPNTGWGRSQETWLAMETIKELQGPSWFNLGDRDIGLHLERTRSLRAGESLSQFTRRICQAWGIQGQVIPMSDQAWPTWVNSDDGELPFQEYFVHRQCQPHVTGFRFGDGGQAAPAPGVLASLEQANYIVFCPSNPWVSIDPILAVAGVKEVIARRQAAGTPVVAVSPIIGGQTIKGPAAKMFNELGIQPSAVAVAEHYRGLVNGFIYDEQDHRLENDIQSLGMHTLVTNTIMLDNQDRIWLAQKTVAFCHHLNDS